MDRAHRIGQTKTTYVYRLVTQDTCEEKIVERQAIKLKVDQVFIQQGHTINQQSKSLTFDEYQKTILHGANKLMERKMDMVLADQLENQDIDKLIEEGIARVKKIGDQADNQAKQIAEEQIKKASGQNDADGNGGLDLTMQKIDFYKFQDQDFREVRQQFQTIMAEKMREELAAKAALAGKDGTTRSARFRRAGAG